MNNLDIIDGIRIENLIYEVRGKQVMLDSDLAKIYKCKNGTKSINLAVKRHIDRFPERFMFKLTEEEYNNLKFQSETSSYNSHGGVRKLPYAFTEQGVAMLSAVLKTGVAESVWFLTMMRELNYWKVIFRIKLLVMRYFMKDKYLTLIICYLKFLIVQRKVL